MEHSHSVWWDTFTVLGTALSQCLVELQTEELFRLLGRQSIADGGGSLLLPGSIAQLPLGELWETPGSRTNHLSEANGVITFSKSERCLLCNPYPNIPGLSSRKSYIENGLHLIRDRAIKHLNWAAGIWRILLGGIYCTLCNPAV